MDMRNSRRLLLQLSNELNWWLVLTLQIIENRDSLVNQVEQVLETSREMLSHHQPRQRASQVVEKDGRLVGKWKQMGLLFYFRV